MYSSATISIFPNTFPSSLAGAPQPSGAQVSGARVHADDVALACDSMQLEERLDAFSVSVMRGCLAESVMLRVMW